MTLNGKSVGTPLEQVVLNVYSLDVRHVVGYFFERCYETRTNPKQLTNSTKGVLVWMAGATHGAPTVTDAQLSACDVDRAMAAQRCQCVCVRAFLRFL